jgi:hypothetical protein
MVPVLPTFTQLAGATAAKHDTQVYGRDIFRAVSQVPGAVLLAAEHGQELAGGFPCLQQGDTFYLWAATASCSSPARPVQLRSRRWRGCFCHHETTPAGTAGLRALIAGVLAIVLLGVVLLGKYLGPMQLPAQLSSDDGETPDAQNSSEWLVYSSNSI